MKKTLFTLVLVIIGTMTAHAQLWLGGAVSANLTKETKTFSIAPDVGYW